MRRTITVGIDGSPESIAAADWAAREAERSEAALLLVHAQPPNPAHRTLVTPTDPRSRPEIERRVAVEAVARLHDTFPELHIDADEVTGHPVEALLDAGRTAELLVLGSRGAGAVREALLGSVALAVAGQSQAPTVLVPSGYLPAGDHQPDADGEPSTGTPYRDVLAGMDTSLPSDHVIGFAFEAAARRGARLRIAVGYDGRRADRAEGGVSAARGSAEFQDLLAQWREKFPHTEVTTEVVVGDAERHLIEAGAGACLLVVGRRAGGPGLGPVAHAVLRRVHVPVAVVPHP